jgi:hemoglobin
VINDKVIGYLFTDVVQLDFEKHIPIICDFWETTLFGQMKYKGNPMLKHIELNKKESLKAEHFERWMYHWENTVEKRFIGTKAIEAIQRAKLIGELMKHKIKQSESDSPIS